MPEPLRIIKTACPHDCPDACSILAHVQGDRLLRVEGSPHNPYTRGSLCRKVAHYEERVYSPDRVLYPLRRIGAKGEGKWERISWDAAIQEITTRWKGIIAEYGPEAVLPYSYAGTMGMVNMLACEGRLWNRMGASHLLRTICSSAATEGYRLVYGPMGGMDPEDFANSSLIIAWGINLSSTNVHLMPFVREAQAKGALFVVIDPFCTRTASAADRHIAVKPGTDAALALGLMHVLFAEGLHDEAFLEAHSVGWKELRNRCLQYTPQRVEEITGVEAETIVWLARACAERTTAIRLGYGLSRTAKGGGMVRAIACLPAVLGAWGKPGSGILLSASSHFPLRYAALLRPDLQVEPDSQSSVHWGRKRPRAINMNRIGAALLQENNPPVKSLYVFNCNPAAVAPHSGKVRQGLLREDLFTVVHEQMMTDTAQLADIVLPATTQMECLDLLTSYGHLYLNLCTPAIPPLGEARANIDVMNQLAHAMGYTEDAFQQDAEAIIRAALQSSSPIMQGVTYEALQQHGFMRLNVPSPYRPGADGHFPTPSGKVEFYSERAAHKGYDPLPNYEPPEESAAANPALAAQYPVNLLSPAAHHFLNSSFANIPSLQKGEKEPRIWIHPQDAEERGIEEGDWLRVWNQRGEVRLRAVLSRKVQPGVAWSPSLWWQKHSPQGSNVNALTSDSLTDMGGGSTFHTNLVQFERLDAS